MVICLALIYFLNATICVKTKEININDPLFEKVAALQRKRRDYSKIMSSLWKLRTIHQIITEEMRSFC
jgi:hypothetical protein